MSSEVEFKGQFHLDNSPISLVFKQIKPEQTIQLRQLVLWPTIPLDKQLIPAYDFEENTIHLGTFLETQPDDDVNTKIPTTLRSIGDEYLNGENPIGILTLTQEHLQQSSKLLQDGMEVPSIQIQLHKFAIHPSFQGKSIGKQLLSYAIATLKMRFTDEQKILFHFDARINQRMFYEKSGMKLLDEKSFWKFGSTGKEEGVEYVKMGSII